MSPMMNNVSSVDEYIKAYPKEVQVLLQKLRQVIRAAAPEAEETIRYGIPTFRLHGKNVVHFGAYQDHIGFYPAPRGIEAFKDELAPYIAGKGTVRFPLDQPLPFDLVKKIVQFRVTETTAKK